jgi:hypothetical protein
LREQAFTYATLTYFRLGSILFVALDIKIFKIDVNNFSEFKILDIKFFSKLMQVTKKQAPKIKKKKGVFSKEVICTLLITNLISIILGAGIGSVRGLLKPKLKLKKY